MIGVCSVHCLRNAETNANQENIISNQRQLNEKFNINLQDQKKQQVQLQQLQLTMNKILQEQKEQQNQQKELQLILNKILQEQKEQRKEQQQLQTNVVEMLGYIPCIKRIFEFIHSNLMLIVHLLIDHFNIVCPN